MTLTPSPSSMLQKCATCAKRLMVDSGVLRASQGAGLTLARGTHSEALRSLRITGGITLTAHAETATVTDPVEITSHAGVLTIAVIMPVERYVEQVVASESGPADSLESLKALAIVVRSYALHEEHGHPDYDLCDSTHCQLLHWHRNPRSLAAHAATLATAGETLWFHGRRAAAYFSKDCGGLTASAVEVWPRMQPTLWLVSHPDAWCSRDGGGWATELSRAELAAALARRGIAVSGWQQLSIERRGESGRVIALRLDRQVINAEAFRIAVGESLGWSRIPSTWFEVSQQGDRFFFHGRGTGHGVGLCQKGSAAMAAQGRSWRDILAQYFPGAEAADDSSGKVWQKFDRTGFSFETLNAADATFLNDLSRARAEASQVSGLNSTRSFIVRSFSTTEAFRNATLVSGWTAAFTEGDWIATQSLTTLAARRLLIPTLRHEFLHALVEDETGPRAPLWLREGLVELWNTDPGRRTGLQHGLPVMPLNALDAALSHATSESQSASAHHDAGIYAARLVDRYGRAQVLGWLRSGVPADALVRIGQR